MHATLCCSETARALSYITSIESLQQCELGCIPGRSLEHIVIFAKILLAVKEGDVDKCLQLVRTLLQNELTHFDTALTAVKKITELINKDTTTIDQSNHRSQELFKMMCLKYPRYAINPYAI